jgi:hypothetical protein
MEQSTVLTTTEDQKRAKYYKTTKEMVEHHKKLADLAQSVITLATHVGSLEKGQILRFYVGDEYYEFGKKDIRAATAKLLREIKDLSTYWKVSKKKPKIKSGPETLKGTYTPIYAGPVLQAFFEAKNGFGPLDPAKWKNTKVMGALLMDSLPYAQKGFMLRNTLTMLFFLYVRTMDLQEPENAQFSHFDEVMKKVFVDMPASFYTANGVTKIPMDEAIAKGLTKEVLSTQDIIRLKRPNFNSEKTPIIKDAPEGKQVYKKAFENYYFQLLASNNYYSKANLKEDTKYSEVLGALNQTAVTDQMIAEHNIVREVAVKWNEYLAPSRKANRDKKKKETDARKKAEKEAAEKAAH